MVRDIAERTVAAWEELAEKDLLPEKVRAAVSEQILAVARTVAQPARK